ncbi:MAG: hypothetical protein J5918_07105 [Prevotella sp.]|nr:hypothetical protein [Prevotella sp.]
MKKQFKFWMIVLPLVLSAGLTSCSDDDFTQTIFDTTEYPLDRTSYTFPLDTFLKVSYLEPYNMSFKYRMEDIGSDLQKNLVPASYDASVHLAVLSKYLWYDVYAKYGGERFLKENSPRIIHVIGSKSYNPSQGTETLGVAEGGLKITLYNANNLPKMLYDPYMNGRELSDVDRIELMNKYFFKTMHHEFGHILDQTHLHPLSFNTISTGSYNSTGWSDTHDSIAAGRGFVTPYASMNTSEDWVETLANYITRDSVSWATLLQSASYEWEEIDYDKSQWEDKIKPNCNYDTIGYKKNADNGEVKIVRRVCKRNGDDTQSVILDENGKVQWIHNSTIFGDQVIMTKLGLVREWMQKYYSINIDDLRREVQLRQFKTNADGTFVKDRWGKFVNRLTSPVDGSSQTLIEQLLEQVYKFKELQTK